MRQVVSSRAVTGGRRVKDWWLEDGFPAWREVRHRSVRWAKSRGSTIAKNEFSASLCSDEIEL